MPTLPMTCPLSAGPGGALVLVRRKGERWPGEDLRQSRPTLRPQGSDSSIVNRAEAILRCEDPTATQTW